MTTRVSKTKAARARARAWLTEWGRVSGFYSFCELYGACPRSAQRSRRQLHRELRTLGAVHDMLSGAWLPRAAADDLLKARLAREAEDARVAALCWRIQHRISTEGVKAVFGHRTMTGSVRGRTPPPAETP